MNVKSEPTHTLTVTVPLYLAESDRFDYHPVDEALRVVMAVTRLAVDRVVCGDAFVELKSSTTESVSP